MKIFILFFAFATILNHTYSQSINVDSLVLKIDSIYADSARMKEIKEKHMASQSINSKASLLNIWQNDLINDTTRLNAIKLVIHQIARVEFERAMELCDSMYFISQASDLKDYMAYAHWLKGICYKHKFQYKNAIEAYDKSREIIIERDNKTLLCRIMYFRAEAKWTRGNYIGALADWKESLLISQELDDSYLMAQSLNGLGLIYGSQGYFEKALDYFFRVLASVDHDQFYNSVPVAFMNIGRIYRLHGEYELAEAYIKRSINILNYRHGYAEFAGTELASVYYFKGKYANAMEILESNLTRAKISGDSELESNNLFWISKILKIHAESLKIKGNARLSKIKYDSAVLYGERALSIAQEIELAEETGEIAKFLYQIHIADEKPIQAIKKFELYVKTRDRIEVEAIKKRLAINQFELQVKQVQDSLEMVRLNEKLTFEANIERRQIIQNATFGIVVLLLILLYVSYRYYISKQRSNFILSEKNKQLEVINQEKNKLIGMVAHDLRSPLNSVKGLVNITKIEDEESEKERYMELITQSTDCMTDMVNRILDVSAVESKSINLKMEKVDLVELLNQLMVNFRINGEMKKQQLNLISKCKKAVVEIDKNYFIQVLENLVSNAIKYSDFSTEIHIFLEKIEGQIRIFVQDQGQGISAEDQKKLFKEFATLSSKPTGDEKATGLGLSIVKKYVEAMKGKIWCESELGLGSKFIMQFELKSS